MDTFLELEENVINLNNLPHCVCYNKMACLYCDVIMEEIATIIKECSMELVCPFVSLAADHYIEIEQGEEITDASHL